MSGDDHTTSADGLAILAGTIRKNQPNNKELIDNVVKFYVRVITEPLNLAGSYVDMLLSDSFIQPPFEIQGTKIVPTKFTSEEKAVRPRLAFMGKILRASNGLRPHIFLKDPCRLAYAGETDIAYLEKIISLHTLFVSQSGMYGVTPKFGDVVSVTLGVSDFQGPELKVASFSEVSSTQDSELYNTERAESCASLKSRLFLDSADLSELGELGVGAVGSRGYKTYRKQEGDIFDATNISTPEALEKMKIKGTKVATHAIYAAKEARYIRIPDYTPGIEVMHSEAQPIYKVFLWTVVDKFRLKTDRRNLSADAKIRAGADAEAAVLEELSGDVGAEAFEEFEFGAPDTGTGKLSASKKTFHHLGEDRSAETFTITGVGDKASYSSFSIPRYIPFINSTRRSVKHQLYLKKYNSLATDPPCKSKHHYGFAMDIKFYVPKILTSGDLVHGYGVADFQIFERYGWLFM